MADPPCIDGDVDTTILQREALSRFLFAVHYRTEQLKVVP
jgi:hypothetical protein